MTSDPKRHRELVKLRTMALDLARLADGLLEEPEAENDDGAEPRPVKRARAPRAVTRPPGESDELSARLASNALRRSGFTGRKVE